MSLSVTTLDRVFKFQNGNEEMVLADPNPEMTPDEVMEFYSANYTELTTATVHGPKIKDDRIIYHFKTTIGTKG